MKKILMALTLLITISCTQKNELPMCMHDNSCPPKGYYSTLKSQCAGDSCCESSVDSMKMGGHKKASKGPRPCSYGMVVEMNKCVGSYEWCVPRD